MSEVDYYDVQGMIRDARSEIRGEIDNAVRAACRELRSEFASEMDDLSREIRAVADAFTPPDPFSRKV